MLDPSDNAALLAEVGEFSRNLHERVWSRARRDLFMAVSGNRLPTVLITLLLAGASGASGAFVPSLAEGWQRAIIGFITGAVVLLAIGMILYLVACLIAIGRQRDEARATVGDMYARQLAARIPYASVDAYSERQSVGVKVRNSGPDARFTVEVDIYYHGRRHQFHAKWDGTPGDDRALKRDMTDTAWIARQITWELPQDERDALVRQGRQALCLTKANGEEERIYCDDGASIEINVRLLRAGGKSLTDEFVLKLQPDSGVPHLEPKEGSLARLIGMIT